MKVFVAGASGALGRPTVRRLIQGDHEVVGLTRSEAKAATLRSLGAEVVIGDVLDAAAMERCVSQARPEGVLQLLNDLPKSGPMRPSDIESTNVLRTKGTKNLLAAAEHHGVRRYVAESMVFGYGYGDAGETKVTEEHEFPIQAPHPSLEPALDALGSLEEQIRDATARGAIEGVILRLGLFYGPEVASTEFMISLLKKHLFPLPGGAPGILSWIHIEDAAEAVVAALERGEAGDVYNIVDDEPVSLGEFVRAASSILELPKPFNVPLWLARLGGRYASRVATTNLRVSNDKAKAALGWAPKHANFREGLWSLRSRRLPAA